MANAARQEVEIRFGGKPYTVKPTFEVIAGIEAATDQPCIALARKCYASDSRGLPSLTEMGQIMYNLLRPFGGPDADAVGVVLMDDGFIDLCIPVGDILSRALKGNKEHLRQAEEAARLAAQEAGPGAAADPPLPPVAT